MDRSESAQAPGWLDSRLPLCTLWRRQWRDHLVPANLTPVWSFGVLVAVALGVLTLSGVWLGFAYVPTARGAALSIDRYTRETNFGWLIRDLHRDGATMLFGVVFIEVIRGIYFGSYRNRRELAWIIEIVRLFAFQTMGFLGFAMTGSAASRAAVTIMARHIAAIPLFGAALAHWFLGGFTIGPATAPRLAMAHEALGFLVLLIAALGYAASRAAAPANPDGIGALDPRDLAPQSAYAGKLFAAFIIFALIFAVIVTFAPGLGFPHGGGLTGPLALPVRPVPPWYELGFHGLARAGQTPGGGTLLTVAAFVLLAALPWLDRGVVASGRYRPVYGGFVLILAIDWAVLSVAAARQATGIWPAVIDITAFYFFLHFIVITPLVTALERAHPTPSRIARRTV